MSWSLPYLVFGFHIVFPTTTESKKESEDRVVSRTLDNPGILYTQFTYPHEDGHRGWWTCSNPRKKKERWRKSRIVSFGPCPGSSVSVRGRDHLHFLKKLDSKEGPDLVHVVGRTVWNPEDQVSSLGDGTSEVMGKDVYGSVWRTWFK